MAAAKQCAACDSNTDLCRGVPICDGDIGRTEYQLLGIIPALAGHLHQPLLCWSCDHDSPDPPAPRAAGALDYVCDSRKPAGRSLWLGAALSDRPAALAWRCSSAGCFDDGKLDL